MGQALACPIGMRLLNTFARDVRSQVTTLVVRVVDAGIVAKGVVRDIEKWTACRSAVWLD